MTLPALIAELEAGQVWRLPCPFHLKTDSNGDLTADFMPGREEFEDHHGVRYVDDGEGYEVRKIVAMVPVEGYRPRLLYERRWISPDGREFGKKGLRCTTVAAFKGWCRYGTTWNSGTAELQS